MLEINIVYCQFFSSIHDLLSSLLSNSLSSMALFSSSLGCMPRCRVDAGIECDCSLIFCPLCCQTLQDVLMPGGLVIRWRVRILREGRVLACDLSLDEDLDPEVEDPCPLLRLLALLEG